MKKVISYQLSKENVLEISKEAAGAQYICGFPPAHPAGGNPPNIVSYICLLVGWIKSVPRTD